MQSLPDLVHQSADHPLLFALTAVLLGALQGLESGHSKTMMAAFIIAIRGTVGQAVLLGLSAMISHTAIVWVVALGGQYLFHGLNTGAIEPYFQIASAILIACIALWMTWRVWRDRKLGQTVHDHEHRHHHHDDDGDGHSHYHHGEEVRRIDTAHGVMALEDGVPPRWRIRFETGHGWKAEDVSVVTERPDLRRRLQRLISAIRANWPRVRIMLRVSNCATRQRERRGIGAGRSTAAIMRPASSNTTIGWKPYSS